MVKVRWVFVACGQSFEAVVEVPKDYVRDDGTLKDRWLKNRLETNRWRYCRTTRNFRSCSRTEPAWRKQHGNSESVRAPYAWRFSGDLLPSNFHNKCDFS